jgi:hypothetical protein
VFPRKSAVHLAVGIAKNPWMLCVYNQWARQKIMIEGLLTSIIYASKYGSILTIGDKNECDT